MDRGREVDEGAPIRVLVVDDHDLFRTGLASLLSEQEDIEVVAQASNGRLGVRLARELRPRVILMDLRLPGIDGVDATRAIVERDPSVRVIALTVADGEADVAAAVLAGACGYLVKDAPMDNVVLAVRAAARGESWLSQGAAAALMERLRSQHVEPEPEVCGAESLSPRELEVLRLMARGMENSEIAAELQISPRTAKNHVSSILGKLGLTNRIEAATYAVRRGLG
jgi:DNA-binding NarL/FixJ family response regulator